MTCDNWMMETKNWFPLKLTQLISQFLFNIYMNVVLDIFDAIFHHQLDRPLVLVRAFHITHTYRLLSCNATRLEILIHLSCVWILSVFEWTKHSNVNHFSFPTETYLMFLGFYYWFSTFFICKNSFILFVLLFNPRLKWIAFQVWALK